MLLEPADERFDGPAPAVDLGDDHRLQVELVGDEDQHVASLRVHEADPANLVGIVSLADKEVELDGLVAAQAVALLDGPTFRDVERRVRFEAGDREGPGAVPSMQSRKI